MMKLGSKERAKTSLDLYFAVIARKLKSRQYIYAIAQAVAFVASRVELKDTRPLRWLKMQ